MKTTVKKWFNDKGFGFLKNGSGPDIFVSKTHLKNCEFLKPGVEVEFECHPAKKGLEARNVKLAKSKTNHNQFHIEQPRFVMQ